MTQTIILAFFSFSLGWLITVEILKQIELYKKRKRMRMFKQVIDLEEVAFKAYTKNKFEQELKSRDN